MRGYIFKVPTKHQELFDGEALLKLNKLTQNNNTNNFVVNALTPSGKRVSGSLNYPSLMSIFTKNPQTAPQQFEEAEKMNKARRTIIMPRSNSKPLGKIHIMPKGTTTANVKAKKAQLIADAKKAAKQRLKEADKNIKRRTLTVGKGKFKKVLTMPKGATNNEIKDAKKRLQAIQKKEQAIQKKEQREEEAAAAAQLRLEANQKKEQREARALETGATNKKAALKKRRIQLLAKRGREDIIEEKQKARDKREELKRKKTKEKKVKVTTFEVQNRKNKPAKDLHWEDKYALLIVLRKNLLDKIRAVREIDTFVEPYRRFEEALMTQEGNALGNALGNNTLSGRNFKGHFKIVPDGRNTNKFTDQTTFYTSVHKLMNRKLANKPRNTKIQAFEELWRKSFAGNAQKTGKQVTADTMDNLKEFCIKFKDDRTLSETTLADIRNYLELHDTVAIDWVEKMKFEKWRKEHQPNRPPDPAVHPNVHRKYQEMIAVCGEGLMVNSNSKTKKKFSHLGLLIQRMRNYTVPRNQFHGIENAPNQSSMNLLLQNAMNTAFPPDSRCPTENIKTATETARQAIKGDATYKQRLPLSRPNPIPATLFSHPTSFYYSTMASNAKASRNTIQMIRDMNYAFRPVEERIHRRSDRKSEELQKQIKQRTIKHKKERKDAITAKLKDFIQGTPLEDMSKDESLEFQESVQRATGMPRVQRFGTITKGKSGKAMNPIYTSKHTISTSCTRAFYPDKKQYNLNTAITKRITTRQRRKPIMEQRINLLKERIEEAKQGIQTTIKWSKKYAKRFLHILTKRRNGEQPILGTQAENFRKLFEFGEENFKGAAKDFNEIFAKPEANATAVALATPNFVNKAFVERRLQDEFSLLLRHPVDGKLQFEDFRRSYDFFYQTLGKFDTNKLAEAIFEPLDTVRKEMLVVMIDAVEEADKIDKTFENTSHYSKRIHKPYRPVLRQRLKPKAFDDLKSDSMQTRFKLLSPTEMQIEHDALVSQDRTFSAILKQLGDRSTNKTMINHRDLLKVFKQYVPKVDQEVRIVATEMSGTEDQKKYTVHSVPDTNLPDKNQGFTLKNSKNQLKFAKKVKLTADALRKMQFKNLGETHWHEHGNPGMVFPGQAYLKPARDVYAKQLRSNADFDLKQKKMFDLQERILERLIEQVFVLLVHLQREHRDLKDLDLLLETYENAVNLEFDEELDKKLIAEFGTDKAQSQKNTLKKAIIDGTYQKLLKQPNLFKNQENQIKKNLKELQAKLENAGNKTFEQFAAEFQAAENVIIPFEKENNKTKEQKRLNKNIKDKTTQLKELSDKQRVIDLYKKHKTNGPSTSGRRTNGPSQQLTTTNKSIKGPQLEVTTTNKSTPRAKRNFSTIVHHSVLLGEHIRNIVSKDRSVSNVSNSRSVSKDRSVSNVSNSRSVSKDRSVSNSNQPTNLFNNNEWDLPFTVNKK